jgi:hypothetical protein
MNKIEVLLVDYFLYILATGGGRNNLVGTAS